MAAGDVEVELTETRAFSGAKFDGINDRAFIGTQQIFNNGFVQSVSLWFKSKNNGTAQGIFVWLNTGDNNRLYVSISNLGVIQFFNGDSTAYTIKAAGAWDENIWHNIVVVRDAQNLTGTAYFDGNLVINHVAMSPNPNAATNTALYLGAIGTGSFFEGTISKVSIYEKELSQAEVTKLAAGQDVTDGLQMRWNLKDDYNSCCGNYNLTNDGSVLLTVDDYLADTLIGQRSSAGASAKFLIAKGGGGQIMTAAIEE